MYTLNTELLKVIVSICFAGTEHMKMIFIVAGLMGFLGIAMLSVIAIKAIMTYYKQ